jgi:nucleolar protein 56
MPKYIFTNIIGSFVFDEQLNVVEKIILNEGDIAEDIEKKLSEKHKAIIPETKQLRKILEFFKKDEFFRQFYKRNILFTKKQIKDSVSRDILIMETIACVEDIDKVINTLSKRLREWYSYYNPEFSNSISNNERFAYLILEKTKKELLKEINIPEDSTMGADLSNEDLAPILSLAAELKTLYLARQNFEKYLETLMNQTAPNLTAITGITIGAKLIEKAGGLKRLSQFPASTIQLLGAEKALFRHMRTGAKAPKYGLLHEHSMISTAKKQNHGKIARALADKISIAVKIDYFKGEFIGDKLRKDLEEKFKGK